MARIDESMELSAKRHAEIMQLYREMNGDNHKRMKVSQQAVITNGAGEVLILHEPIENNWLLPGGRMEEGDTTPEQSLKREVQEELGTDISIGELLRVDISHAGLTYAVAFLCSIPDNSKIQLSNEHDEYKWVSPSELENYLYYRNIALAIAKRLS